MCPACIATAAWAVTAATGAGGLTAFVVKKRRTKNATETHTIQKPTERES